MGAVRNPPGRRRGGKKIRQPARGIQYRGSSEAA